MPSDDPFPDIETFQVAADLKRMYPNSDVRAEPVRCNLFMTLPLSGGKSLRAGLTWSQAKYFAYKKVRFDDLTAGKYPEDWPK